MRVSLVALVCIKKKPVVHQDGYYSVYLKIRLALKWLFIAHLVLLDIGIRKAIPDDWVIVQHYLSRISLGTDLKSLYGTVKTTLSLRYCF